LKTLTTLEIRVINCEIRVVIYTPFELFGSEECRKYNSSQDLAGFEKVTSTTYEIRCESVRWQFRRIRSR
jgi:hypothetical protein